MLKYWFSTVNGEFRGVAATLSVPHGQWAANTIPEIMVNPLTADRIYQRLASGWSHPGLGGWNPHPSGSCITIHKDWTNHIKKANEDSSNKVMFFPGTVFRAVWFQREDWATDVQAARLRSQFQELPLPFLCCWLLSPLYPWVSSNIWPCFGPIWACNQSQRTTKFPGKKTLRVLCGLACMGALVSADAHTHTHTAIVAYPIPLKACCGLSAW